MVADDEMTWRTHLFARRRGRGVFALAVVAATLALVQLFARSAALTALGAVVFAATLWPFFFPVRYALDATGVRADYGLWRRRWGWERFRAYVALSDAVLLTPFPRPHRLERFRALLLPCPGSVPEVVTRLAGRLVQRHPERRGASDG